MQLMGSREKSSPLWSLPYTMAKPAQQLWSWRAVTERERGRGVSDSYPYHENSSQRLATWEVGAYWKSSSHQVSGKSPENTWA